MARIFFTDLRSEESVASSDAAQSGANPHPRPPSTVALADALTELGAACAMEPALAASAGMDAGSGDAKASEAGIE
jgi:hypothetical protein